jgi:hypothetical protein
MSPMTTKCSMHIPNFGICAGMLLNDDCRRGESAPRRCHYAAAKPRPCQLLRSNYRMRMQEGKIENSIPGSRQRRLFQVRPGRGQRHAVAY